MHGSHEGQGRTLGELAELGRRRRDVLADVGGHARELGALGGRWLGALATWSRRARADALHAGAELVGAVLYGHSCWISLGFGCDYVQLGGVEE